MEAVMAMERDEAAIEEFYAKTMEAMVNLAINEDFERMAEDWAWEYDQYFSLSGGSSSIIAKLMKFGSTAASRIFGTPDRQTNGYKFEQAVNKLRETHHRQMLCLTNWYWHRDWTMQMRVEYIRKQYQIPMNKNSFYAFLGQAKILVRKELLGY